MRQNLPQTDTRTNILPPGMLRSLATIKRKVRMSHERDHPMGLEYIWCPCCSSHKAREVIHAEKMIRKGWYCSRCKHFDSAIGRERLVDPASPQPLPPGQQPHP